MALSEQEIVVGGDVGVRGVAQGPVVLVDLDTVLLAVHQGKRGVELGLQADLEPALDRLATVARQILVLVEPPPTEPRHGLETERRLEVFNAGLGAATDQLVIVTCPHGEDGTCTCAKPEAAIIQVALEKHDVPRRGTWYVGGDQEGVVAAHNAGLHTIRIGPATTDHLGQVARPDYEARDMLDAANHIMLESMV